MKKYIILGPEQTIELDIDLENKTGRIYSNLRDGVSDEDCIVIHILESLVLAHTCEGIDVCSHSYVKGLQAALDAICNNV